MSDNKLLAENTIRRFMKLANTEALAENFIDESAYRKGGPNDPNRKPKKPEDKKPEDKKPEDKKPEEQKPAPKNMEEEISEEVQEESVEAEVEALQEEEEELELDMDMGDMDPEPEPEASAEPEMAEADMSLTEEEARLLVSLGERLKAAMDAEAGDEPELEDEAPEDPEEEMPEMEDDETAKAYSMEESREDLVNEVLKRVTKRLVAEKLKNRK